MQYLKCGKTLDYSYSAMFSALFSILLLIISTMSFAVGTSTELSSHGLACRNPDIITPQWYWAAQNSSFYCAISFVHQLTYIGFHLLCHCHHSVLQGPSAAHTQSATVFTSVIVNNS